MAEEILQKVEDELNCRICLDRYKDPKLLLCFHVYCKACLGRLAYQEICCPECRQITPLPADNGVAGLKAAFYINRLLGIIQEDLKKEKRCCSEHGDEELKLYCETCGILICLRCITKGGEHHSHDHEILDEALKKYREEISSSFELIKKQMTKVSQALNQLDAHCRKIVNQQATVEAEIHNKYRKMQIASQLHQITDTKLKNLASQKQQLKNIESQLKGCLEFMEKSKETDDCQDVLEMKRSVIKKIKELTVPIQPDISTVKGDVLYSGSFAVCQSTDILIFKGGSVLAKTAETRKWFFGNITRGDAEKQLLQVGNLSGCFLVRASTSEPGKYSLSIRDGDSVKHYLISKGDPDGYYLDKDHICNSLEELIQLYTNSSNGLCCKLTVVCPPLDTPAPPKISTLPLHISKDDVFIQWISGDMSNTETVFAFPANDKTSSYISAILRLPIAFYFNALTGTILLGDTVRQRRFPSLVLLPVNAPVAEILRRSAHDRFRPPYGEAIEYLTSIGYGSEVGLPDGMQEVYDPCSKRSLILDHSKSKIIPKDFRPNPESMPCSKPTVISLSQATATKMPFNLCTEFSIVRAASERAHSKRICCTLTLRGQDGRCGVGGKPGTPGADGADGFKGDKGLWGIGAKRNGQSGRDGHQGGRGEDGGDGGNGSKGGDAIVILSGSANVLLVRGTKEFKAHFRGTKSEEILFVDCHGGNGGTGGYGGKGGRGGNGGDGGDGVKGNSPIGPQDGGNGGNGGHGGGGSRGAQGGNSGDGGDAGYGGNCLIQTADARLLMLVEVDCMQGEPGAGVNGGNGGDGGKPGIGGQGGPGGYRGGDQRTFPGYTGHDGRNGDRGRSGPSGESGRNGKSGTSGGILWVVNSGGITCKSGVRYDAKVESLKVIPTLNDGIFEPNERIIISGIIVHSTGGLDLPQGVSALIPSTQTIKFESSCFNLPHAIKAGEKYTIPFNFQGRIFDLAPPNKPGRQILKAEFSTRIELLGRPFEKCFLKHELFVQYPVQLGILYSPEFMSRGEVASISIGVKNLSRLLYGNCNGSGGRVVLHLHFDSRITPIAADAPYVVTFDPNLRDSTFVELSKIPPQKEVTVTIRVQMANCAELFDHCPWQVDLHLRDKLIEYSHESIRVTTTYSPQEIPADVLLVTNWAMTRNEFVFWQNTFEVLEVSFDIWDTDVNYGLSLDSHTGMRHKTSWRGRYSGKMILYPHCNLQLLSGVDIAQHFNGDDKLSELGSSLIVFMPQCKSAQQNECAMLKHLAVVNTEVEVPENAYSGKHILEPGYEELRKWEKSFIKDLEQKTLTQAPLLLARRVHITSIGFLRYSYGSIDVRLMPILKSSKFLLIDGVGELDANSLSPLSTHIPLGSKYGQAILATLHGITTSAKLRLMKRRFERNDLPRVFMLHPLDDAVMTREAVLMIILAWEVADELFTCSGEAHRMKEIYTDIMDNTDAYLPCGRTILCGLKLIKKEFKKRRSAGLKHYKVMEAYRKITDMSSNIRKKFLEAGIKSSKLEDLVSLKSLRDSNRVHHCHREGKWDLTGT